MTFPKRYDVLVILAGDKPTRHPAALDLLRRGWADYLTVTGEREYVEPDPPELAAHILRAAPSRNTYEDALSIKALLIEHRFASVLVLTSVLHGPRAHLVLRRVLSDLPIRVDVMTWEPVIDGTALAPPNITASALAEIAKTIGYRIRRRA